MTAAEENVRIEISPKRVRAYFRGQVVFDTTEPRLVWEVPYYPQYYVRRADVLAELVPAGRTKTSSTLGVGDLQTVRVGEHEAVEAATTYVQSPVDELHDLVRVQWDAMDAWFEEDEEVFTHPRSPYARVDILPTSRRVVVEAAGEVVAESTQAHVLFETGLPARYYLPKLDSRMDLLTATDQVTHCPYKGQSEYWSIKAGGRMHENAAWSYRHPLAESIRIAGLVSFDPAKVDVIVDGAKLPSR